MNARDHVEMRRETARSNALRSIGAARVMLDQMTRALEAGHVRPGDYFPLPKHVGDALGEMGQIQAIGETLQAFDAEAAAAKVADQMDAERRARVERGQR